MRILRKLVFIYAILIVSACSKNDDSITIDQNEKLLGSWMAIEYQGTEIKFERVGKLKEDNYGISFLENRVFVERHSGWCGTPPLVFEDYIGIWKKNESIIEINKEESAFNRYQWEIKTLNDKILVVDRVD